MPPTHQCLKINALMDRVVRPRIRLFGHSFSAYHICGVAGFVTATTTALLLVSYLSLSFGVLAALMVAAVATFFALALITKVITGEEYLIYYHHEIAILIVAAMVLWAWGQPILPYLDITILGIGTFLMFGRCGCFMVGCCHGTPHFCGVRYRPQHADEGFTPYYVGIRLFPIQAVESLYVLCIAAVGVWLALHQAPGEALAWYVISYDVGRFTFEFVRGDPDRPYYGGFSEGQWISVGLMVFIVWAEQAGWLPFHLWHSIVTGCILSVMATIAAYRAMHRDPVYRLLNPRHVREIAQALQDQSAAFAQSSGEPLGIRVSYTSFGLQISVGTIKQRTNELFHYALSTKRGELTREAARAVASLICRLEHPGSTWKLVNGQHGFFHVLLAPEAADSRTEGTRTLPGSSSGIPRRMNPLMLSAYEHQDHHPD